MATSLSRQPHVQICRGRKSGSRGVGTKMETFPIDHLEGTQDGYQLTTVALIEPDRLDK